MFYSAFVLRRFLMILSYKLFFEHPIYQILILNYSNLFMMIYQGSFGPFKNPLRNKVESMNEIFIAICSYHMMLYSEWVLSQQVQFNYGWSQIFFMILLITVNLIFVFYSTAKGLFLLCKKIYLITKHKVRKVIQKFESEKEEKKERDDKES